ncbi:unnamed protein product [Cylicocyclus nassatus]|uniref:Uncharacterized protein n=1 Tax=Cylicocyclus nassatus TaxID=53992 RepID=A0AA36HE61_CYLNA|nr:unnamed protein product [Cylicocyclus nassatus]
MAGESLRKKYQEFLLHQVFGDMIGSLYPERSENRENVQEAAADGSTHNEQRKLEEAGDNHGRSGWTEEATEDGDWIVYRRGNGDRECKKEEEASFNVEQLYYESLNLIPGKVPH